MRGNLRKALQGLAELAIERVLGPVPRHLRRSAARLYAGWAYRHLKALPPDADMTPTNQMIVRWIAEEYRRQHEPAAKDASHGPLA